MDLSVFDITSGVHRTLANILKFLQIYLAELKMLAYAVKALGLKRAVLHLISTRVYSISIQICSLLHCMQCKGFMSTRELSVSGSL